MRTRQSDTGDRITENEVRQARATPFQWCKLWLTNLPAVMKIVIFLCVGAGGTVAIPEAYKALTGSTGDELQIAEPDNSRDNIWQGDVELDLNAQKRAIESNSAALKSMQAEITKLELKLKKSSERGDTDLDRRVTAIETLVQP